MNEVAVDTDECRAVLVHAHEVCVPQLVLKRSRRVRTEFWDARVYHPTLELLTADRGLSTSFLADAHDGPAGLCAGEHRLEHGVEFFKRSNMRDQLVEVARLEIRRETFPQRLAPCCRRASGTDAELTHAAQNERHHCRI